MPVLSPPSLSTHRRFIASRGALGKVAHLYEGDIRQIRCRFIQYTFINEKMLSL